MQTSARNFFKAADGNRVAAGILYPHVSQSSSSASSVFFAFYNVFGLALELYLKAFLANAGMTSLVLSKNPYGHNLVRLHEEAVARGLHASTGLAHVHPTALEKVVQIIGAHYGSHTYRYIDDHDQEYQFIKTMDAALVTLDDLHMKIESALSGLKLNRANAVIGTNSPHASP